MDSRSDLSLPLRHITSHPHSSTAHGSHVDSTMESQNTVEGSSDSGHVYMRTGEAANATAKASSVGTDPLRPLHLLDLPLDILSLIVKEVSSVFSLLGLQTLNLQADFSHQRPLYSRNHSFCPPQSRHTTYLFSFRHCMAGYQYKLRHTGWCGRSDIWFGYPRNGGGSVRRGCVATAEA